MWQWWHAMPRMLTRIILNNVSLAAAGLSHDWRLNFHTYLIQKHDDLPGSLGSVRVHVSRDRRANVGQPIIDLLLSSSFYMKYVRLVMLNLIILIVTGRTWDAIVLMRSQSRSGPGNSTSSIWPGCPGLSRYELSYSEFVLKLSLHNPACLPLTVPRNRKNPQFRQFGCQCRLGLF